MGVDMRRANLLRDNLEEVSSMGEEEEEGVKMGREKGRKEGMQEEVKE